MPICLCFLYLDVKQPVEMHGWLLAWRLFTMLFSTHVDHVIQLFFIWKSRNGVHKRSCFCKPFGSERVNVLNLIGILVEEEFVLG